MSLAPFVPTPNEVVMAMLQLAGLQPDETLYDLGCGDGRIVLTAAQAFGAKAVGVELDDGRYNACLSKIAELHLEQQVKILHTDLLKVDLSDADVVTLYLLTTSNEKVKPNLELYLKRGARVVSHDFEIPGWTPTSVQNIEDLNVYGDEYPFSHRLYLYKR